MCYRVAFQDCEHFVTKLRCGRRVSHQVRTQPWPRAGGGPQVVPAGSGVAVLHLRLGRGGPIAPCQPVLPG